MKFVTISDVHIKDSGDKAESLFLKFLDTDQVKDSDVIYLLGDIFDLFIGPHVDHLKKYENIFSRLDKLSKMGKKIHYFEGNHDFHFKKLLDKKDNWFYHKKPYITKVNDQRFFFAHGDEIEMNNLSYQRYRRFIRSRLIRLAAEYLVSYKLVDGIGSYFSKKSRERNIKNYGTHNESEEVRKSFRENILWAYEEYKRPNKIFCGHSHCQEELVTGDFSYYNNGFFPASQIFFYFNGKSVETISLQVD